MANQQLPAFDWHYLFGHTTVLLVALHLAFNFRIAWNYVTRRAPNAPRVVERRAPTIAGAAGRAAVAGQRLERNVQVRRAAR